MFTLKAQLRLSSAQDFLSWALSRASVKCPDIFYQIISSVVGLFLKSGQKDDVVARQRKQGGDGDKWRKCFQSWSAIIFHNQLHLYRGRLLCSGGHSISKKAEAFLYVTTICMKNLCGNFCTLKINNESLEVVLLLTHDLDYPILHLVFQQKNLCGDDCRFSVIYVNCTSLHKVCKYQNVG